VTSTRSLHAPTRTLLPAVLRHDRDTPGSARSCPSRRDRGTPRRLSGAPPSSRGYPRRTFRRPRVLGSSRPIGPSQSRPPLEVRGRELGEPGVDIAPVVGIEACLTTSTLSRGIHVGVSRSLPPIAASAPAGCIDRAKELTDDARAAFDRERAGQSRTPTLLSWTTSERVG